MTMPSPEFIAAHPMPEFTPPSDGSPAPDPFFHWEQDFAAAAAATSRQIAIAADVLEEAVGSKHFGVVAHLMLQKVIETSAEQANLMAAQRQQEQLIAQEREREAQAASQAMRQFPQLRPRPNDPNWQFAGRP